MRHFPLFFDLRGERVLVSGGGEVAVAKLRLLLKTEASVAVYAEAPCDQIQNWSDQGRLRLVARPLRRGDTICAALVYGANDDPDEDERVAQIARADGALVNIVDNLEASDFITPALVDRDPVTVAIGTEGAAPVLARRIKADNEERLPPELGTLARAGQAFRQRAGALPPGRPRRIFWQRYYDEVGPRHLARGGAAALEPALDGLLQQVLSEHDQPGRVSIVGAGPGDPELLTLKARRRLDEADVVIHDRLVAPEVLELARREALVIEVGKTPNGLSWSQTAINELLVWHARSGAHVVRLKSGDPSVFGRLDEELDALEAADIDHEVIPGITAAASAAASVRTSLTKRGRNSSLQFLTGHDVDGFAEHDWRALAKPGAAAAVYMGVRAARFLQGRLLIHGADAQTPVTVVENASRPEQKVVRTSLGSLSEDLRDAGITGPAILFLGLAARRASEAIERPPAARIVGEA
ncbi:MAG: siroheme synthase CysG [Geminicoccaceae bacterium]